VNATRSRILFYSVFLAELTHWTFENRKLTWPDQVLLVALARACVPSLAGKSFTGLTDVCG
jgi:hypothetical protein